MDLNALAAVSDYALSKRCRMEAPYQSQSKQHRLQLCMRLQLFSKCSRSIPGLHLSMAPGNFEFPHLWKIMRAVSWSTPQGVKHEKATLEVVLPRRCGGTCKETANWTTDGHAARPVWRARSDDPLGKAHTNLRSA